MYHQHRCKQVAYRSASVSGIIVHQLGRQIQFCKLYVTNCNGLKMRINNRIGGKRSSFLPTFVFRPLTPPYVPFGIRRFLFWIPFEIRPHQYRLLHSLCSPFGLAEHRVIGIAHKGEFSAFEFFIQFVKHYITQQWT